MLTIDDNQLRVSRIRANANAHLEAVHIEYAQCIASSENVGIFGIKSRPRVIRIQILVEQMHLMQKENKSICNV